MIRSIRLIHNFCNKYKILGVKQSASAQTIKQRYFQLAKLYHPDSNPNKQDIQKFQQIKEAYEILIDDNSRYVHDKKQGLESEWKLKSGLKHANFMNNDQQYNKILNSKTKAAVFDQEIEIDKIYQDNKKSIDNMPIEKILRIFIWPILGLTTFFFVFNTAEIIITKSEEKKRLASISTMKGGAAVNSLPLNIT